MTRIPELEQELVAAARRLQSPRRLLRPGWRWALAGAAVGVVVVLAVLGTMETNDADRRSPPAGTVPAPGAKVVVTDVEAGIRFSLDGRVLTVRLLPDSPGRTVRMVSGARISAVCGANVAADEGGTILTRLWPAGQTSLSYRFPRDVSGWCRLEEQPGQGCLMTQRQCMVAFVEFPGDAPGLHAPGGRLEITEAVSNWAPLFASGAEPPIDYMAQPAVEQMYCQRGETPIPNCTRPSRAYRQSFRAATVQEIAINGDRAAARFSNGETIELQSTDRGWLVDKFGENAGRGFFK